MSNVVKADLDQLNASLTVVIDKESYSPRFETALKNYKNRSQLKGFRKGKVPSSFLKKAYGPAILSDVINEILQEELNQFLRQDTETNYLGHPIPSADQAPVSFDPSDASDFEFRFDIGKAPDFEILGLDANTQLERFTAEITEEEIDKDILGIRSRMGQLQDVEDGSLEEGDLLSLHIHELENGQPREGGIHNHFVLRLDEEIDAPFQEELKKKKIGETFTFDPFKINKEANDGYVRRYYLGLEEDPGREIGPKFEGRLDRVRRAELPPLDQALFDQYFGEGQISSEEEARQRIREELSNYFKRRASNLFFQEMREHILEANRAQLALPDEFLKRWLVATDEKKTEEEVEKTYDRFAESLRWSLIRNKLIREKELQVSEAELREAFADRIRQSVGYQLEDAVIQATVERLLGDQEQVERVAEEIIEEKVFQTVEEAISIVEKPLTFKELSEKEMALYEAREAAGE